MSYIKYTLFIYLVFIVTVIGCGLSVDKVGSAAVDVPAVTVTCDVDDDVCESVEEEGLSMRAYWVVNADGECKAEEILNGNFLVYGDAVVSGADCVENEEEFTTLCTKTISSWNDASGSTDTILEWDYMLCVYID